MIKSFIRTLLGLFCLFLVLVAGAQIVPVQPSGPGIPNWLIGLLGLGAVAVVLFLLLKHKRPQQAAAISGEAQTALTSALSSAHEALSAAHDTIANLTDHLMAKTAAPAPAAAPPASAAPAAAIPQPAAPASAPAPTIAVAAEPAAPASTPTTEAYVPNPQSNTPDWRIWTDTSPEGYPLWYQLQPDGKGGKMPVPGTRATLVYDGVASFNSVQEIRDYMVAVKRRAENMAQADADADVPGKGFPIFSAELVATTLAIFDSAPTDALRYFHLLAAEHFALQNRGMKRAEINTAVNAVNGGAPPEGWDGSAQQAYRG